MNYVFYKESDNSIVGIRKPNQELSDDFITALTLDMSKNFETKILCASVSEDVETAEFMTRYLGFDPQNNALTINPDFTPTPRPNLEEEPIPEPSQEASP